MDIPLFVVTGVFSRKGFACIRLHGVVFRAFEAVKARNIASLAFEGRDSKVFLLKYSFTAERARIQVYGNIVVVPQRIELLQPSSIRDQK